MLRHRMQKVQLVLRCSGAEASVCYGLVDVVVGCVGCSKVRMALDEFPCAVGIYTEPNAQHELLSEAGRFRRGTRDLETCADRLNKLRSNKLKPAGHNQSLPQRVD